MVAANRSGHGTVLAALQQVSVPSSGTGTGGVRLIVAPGDEMTAGVQRNAGSTRVFELGEESAGPPPTAGEGPAAGLR